VHGEGRKSRKTIGHSCVLLCFTEIARPMLMAGVAGVKAV
jgi:hypothetical protein